MKFIKKFFLKMEDRSHVLMIEQLRMLAKQYALEKLPCPFTVDELRGETTDHLKVLYEEYFSQFVNARDQQKENQTYGHLHSELKSLFGKDFSAEKFTQLWETIYSKVGEKHPEVVLIMNCVDKERLFSVLQKALSSEVVKADWLSLALEIYQEVFPRKPMASTNLFDIFTFPLGNSAEPCRKPVSKSSTSSNSSVIIADECHSNSKSVSKSDSKEKDVCDGSCCEKSCAEKPCTETPKSGLKFRTFSSDKEDELSKALTELFSFFMQ